MELSNTRRGKRFKTKSDKILTFFLACFMELVLLFAKDDIIIYGGPKM